jgi:hypothetical protein
MEGVPFSVHRLFYLFVCLFVLMGLEFELRALHLQTGTVPLEPRLQYMCVV